MVAVSAYPTAGKVSPGNLVLQGGLLFHYELVLGADLGEGRWCIVGQSLGGNREPL
jgi:hypothetical protein